MSFVAGVKNRSPFTYERSVPPPVNPTDPAPSWWIDPIHGNDSNSGTSVHKPLKTWQRLQDIFGMWTTLSSPVGLQGTINVTLLNDLPDSDPITLYNLMGNTIGPAIPGQTGIGLFVQGQTKVLATGTLHSSAEAVPGQPPALPIPRIISVNGKPAGYFTPYVGKWIQCIVGGMPVLAAIAADMGIEGGADTAAVGPWTTYTPGGGFLEAATINAAPAPPAGTPYQILDFTSVVFESSLFSGNDVAAYSLPSPTNPTGQIFFNNLHARIPAAAGNNSRTAFVYNTTGFSSVSYFPFYCIFDCQIEWDGPQFGNNFANIHTDIEVTAGAENLSTAYTAHIPGPNAQFPGAMLLGAGTKINIFGEMFFQGNATTGQFADVALDVGSEVAISAPVSFWDCGYCFFCFGGDNLVFFGVNGAVPLYGSGNNYSLWCSPGSIFNFLQTTALPGPDILPNLVFNGPLEGYPPGSVASLGPEFSQYVATSDPSFIANGFPFDLASQVYDSSRLLTWPGLLVAAGGGGFLTRSVPNVLLGGTTKLASAMRPDNVSGLTWQGNLM
jgi:hypothetical protein